MNISQKRKADLLLFITASGWAMSTIIIKLYTETLPVFHLMFGRYAIALIVLTFMQRNKKQKISKSDWKYGGILGILTFLAFTLAIASLYFTSASKSGFFVAMSVLFVPIVTTILHRHLPNKWITFGVLLSLVGLYLISGMNGGGFNRGDALALLCAFSYTVYILILDRSAKQIDESQLAWMQMLVVTIISAVFMIIFEGINLEGLKAAFLPILVIGVLGTALTNYAQIKAQQHATPESVGLILLGEPLFTLIMAAIILHEKILFKGVIGAVLLLLALVITILKDE
ncbi:MAG: DMT family transporter [Clostridia bacterium]|nr:DMT family transporter [Clostridia bacterium]